MDFVVDNAAEIAEAAKIVPLTAEQQPTAKDAISRRSEGQ